MKGKKNIRDLGIEELGEELKKLRLPGFRAKQVFGWVHDKGISSFEEASNLAKELRGLLADKFIIGALKEKRRRVSGDGTVKFLFELHDGGLIETVLLFDGERKTLCLSTQLGCRMSCSLCATARMGFRRNLTAGEIVSQVYQVEREFGRITNVVFMGMGEPFDNYDNVMGAIKILNHPLGKNIGQRHMTVSTCGIVPRIRQFAEGKTQVRLAISLNFPADPARDRMMPINKKYPIKEIVDAVRYYERKTGRRATIEYVLIGGMNDSEEDAVRLVHLLKGVKANVNLIEINPFRGSELRRPGSGALTAFKKILERYGIEVSQRFKRGEDINAACGQLSGGYYE